MQNGRIVGRSHLVDCLYTEMEILYNRKAKKQETAVLSSSESELEAMLEGLKEVIRTSGVF